MHAQSLSLYSGNGQVVQEQFRSNAPMVVLAKDAAGHPAVGVAVNWAITQGTGTLNGPIMTTDANGFASTNFLATNLQPLQSFETEVIRASSSLGNVSFFVTTAHGLTPPSVQLVNPPLANLTITAASGSTVPGAVVVRVIAQSGLEAGSPLPDIGVRIVNGEDPTLTPPAACNAPTGVVLTDASGTATCDLVVTGAAGTTTPLRANAGEIQSTTSFTLTITPGVPCTYSLSASSQSLSAGGGTGTVNVVTAAGCGWNAASNAGFIAITSPTSGTGNGSVSYVVAANSGPARSGTLSIAGQTFTVNQSAAGGSGTLTIPTQTLPLGAVGAFYRTTLTATGGTPPYSWSPVGPISTSGLSLQAAGDISGTPTTAGTYSFTATVADNAGARQSQTFSITVNSTGPPPTGFTITNTSFPNGVVGQPYPSQVLIAVGGCVTPFSPQPSFTVSQGALPVGLSIQPNSDGTHSIAGTPSTSGTSSFTLSATDACAKTATANFTITVTGTPTSLQMLVSPVSVAFTVQAGAPNSPADQTLAISSNSTAFAYSAAVSTTTGANWLVARNASTGSTPGSFTVGATNFASLAPGAYNGTIIITSSAANSPVVVGATLTVLAATPLTVNPTSFTVNQTIGAAISRQAFNLASGTTSIAFTASATTNKGGTWLAVSTTQGNTPVTLTAIINSAGLAVGQYIGTITITPASGAPQTVTITLNVLAPATLLATPAPLAFAYQPGSNLPAPQSVAVTSSGTSLGISVSAATGDGGSWLSASPPNGATVVNLSVAVSPVNLKPGSYSGAITITPTDPTVAPLTIAVTLVVTQAPPVIMAPTNAASYAPGPVAPGEIVTIFGSGMGPLTGVQLHLTDSGTVDTTLGGTQVFFDGYPAPLIYSSATQVSAIVPFEVAGTGTTSMMVQYQGTRSNTMTIPVLDSLPGIFTIDRSGYGQGAILNEDTTLNSSQNGAEPGSIVSIYATGGGQTDPPSADGTLPTDAQPTRLQVKVQIAGETADVIYAGAAPGEPSGMLQVNARIPADIPRGINAPVVIIVGAVSSQAGVTVAIKP